MVRVTRRARMFSSGNRFQCTVKQAGVIFCTATLGILYILTISPSDQGKLSQGLHVENSTVMTKDSTDVKSVDQNIMNMQLLPGCDSDKNGERSSDSYFPESQVESFFNCYLPSSECTYFYPANFFDKDCGIGRVYAEEPLTAEEMRKNRTLWNHMPSIGYPTLTMSNACFPKAAASNTRNPSSSSSRTNRPSRDSILKYIGENTTIIDETEYYCYTERLSFLHVHKSGGTSLHNAFNNLSRKGGTELFRHKWFQPYLSPGNSRTNADVSGRVTDGSMYGIAKEDMQHATTYPVEKFDSKQHAVIAVVRDPIERFISSIGQASGGSGSTGNIIGKVLKAECMKATSRKTLTCYAKYVQQHGFWIELHFTPQILDIWFSMLWQDSPIGVFPFSKLEDVVSHLGMPSAHGRDGSQPRYRSNDVLSNMTVADYDEESLEIVCEIYAMDVIMQRSVGIEVPRCDPFIPR